LKSGLVLFCGTNALLFIADHVLPLSGETYTGVCETVVAINFPLGVQTMVVKDPVLKGGTPKFDQV